VRRTRSSAKQTSCELRRTIKGQDDRRSGLIPFNKQGK
jgi:hypothetical protein